MLGLFFIISSFTLSSVLTEGEQEKPYRSLGITYLQQKKIDQAIESFQKAIQADPQDALSYYYLGIIFVGKGNYELAASNLEKAYLQGLRNSSVLLNLSRVYLKLGFKGKAFDKIDEILKANPQSAQTHFQIGLLLFQNAIYHRSKEALEKARSLDPQSYQISFYLALVNFLLGDFRASLDILNGLGQQRADSAEFLNLLGSVYAKLGQFDKAISTIQQAMRSYPARMDSYFNLGLIYLELGELDKAKELLERAGRRPWERAKVFYYLSDKSGQGSEEPVIATAEKGEVGTAPEKAEFYAYLAGQFQQQYYHRSALELLKIAQQYDPNSAQICFALGVSYYNLRRFPDALHMFSRAIELQPDFDRAYYHLAIVYEVMNELNEAVRTYNKAISLNPRVHIYYYRLAKAIKLLGKYDQAAEMLAKALELNPRHAYSHSELGKLHMERNPAKAIQHLEKAIELDPDFPEPYYQLGRIYAKAGDAKRSQELFQLYKRKKDLRGDLFEDF